VVIDGVPSLNIRSLRDRQQFFDPHGAAARAGFSSADWPLFGLLWPSARPLAARLALRTVQSGERLLEVGCGLGLASLAAHRAGADVTASDSHPLAGRFLRANLRLNAMAALPYRHGPWTASDHVPDGETALSGRFELIFGSDLLYERDDTGRLAGFIGRHAAARSEVWLIDPNRGNRSPFHRRMAVLGYELREETIAGPVAGVAYRGRWLLYSRNVADAGLEGPELPQTP
jgi:SAM-dependent methyltransferase